MHLDIKQILDDNWPWWGMHYTEGFLFFTEFA